MTSSLGDKAFNFTTENSLLPKGSRVVVGVSGGADSMALLHFLHTCELLAVSPIAVHIHHGLRGEEADRDEALLRAYCAEHAIEYVCERVDVRVLAAQFGIGEEEAGRRARYAAFERMRVQRGADAIATAHNADDATETVLMHLLRGCGVGGLCGIPARRGCIVRPLLCCSRAEIEAYCNQMGISYVVDSTNGDVAYTRNSVRHRLLPLLREMNPSVDAALQRLSRSAAADEAYFSRAALRVLETAVQTDGSYAVDELLRADKTVRMRAWKRLLTDGGCHSYTERHLESLENILHSGCGTARLADGYSVQVSSGRLKLFSEAMTVDAADIRVDCLPFVLTVGEHTHVLRRVSRDELDLFENIHKKFSYFSLDYDKILGNLTIRRRRDGDRYHPAGRRVGKSLKELFLELRVPSYERDKALLLCDEQGVVLMPGVACDERVRPQEDTKDFLVWTVDGEPPYTLNYLQGGQPLCNEPADS